MERLPLAGDDTSLLKRQIAEAAERSDIVITSGGVSVGVYDFTKPALRELGAEFFFERVALRPGKPTVFARLPNGTLFSVFPAIRFQSPSLSICYTDVDTHDAGGENSHVAGRLGRIGERHKGSHGTGKLSAGPAQYD